MCFSVIVGWAGGGQTVGVDPSQSESSCKMIYVLLTVVSTMVCKHLYSHLSTSTYSYELKSFLRRLYTESQNPPPKYFYQNPTQTRQNTSKLTYDPLILQQGWTVHSSTPDLSQHRYQI